MILHTFGEGECLDILAKKYGVSEESIRKNNQLENSNPMIGEDLLILTPTREYTICNGDSAERLSLRFGVRKSDLMAMNPELTTEGFETGRKITLKQSSHTHGMSVTNGYYYKGCSRQNLMSALPYLTYITISAYTLGNSGLKKVLEDREILSIADQYDKIPIMRIYVSPFIFEKSGYLNSDFSDRIISVAKEGEYKGIAINTPEGNEKCEEFVKFIIELRGKMIGKDLILITEIESDSPPEYSDCADASVLLSDIDSGQNIYGDFACTGECAKTFIDLPVFAKHGSSYLSLNDGVDLFRRKNCSVTENNLLATVCDGSSSYVFPSLKKIKAILDDLSGYGFMGISFDIMRTPMTYLLMYNSMFKTHYYDSTRAKEGCSRE